LIARPEPDEHSSAPVPLSSNSLVQLDAFLADRRALGREAFLEKYPHPVLVITATPPRRSDEDGLDTAGVTSRIDAYGLNVSSKLMIAPITKREPDPFQGLIWVGREARCDVVLPFDTVSKLQAQFKRRESGLMEVRDPGSTNGTFVNDVRLEKDQAMPLRDRAHLRFGKIAARFRTAEGFWEELARFI
jgi:hypothetical protein